MQSINLNPITTAKIILPLIVFVIILLIPTPDGLTTEGQVALAVMALVVILWATEAMPIAVTGLLGVVLLVLYYHMRSSQDPRVGRCSHDTRIATHTRP